MGNLRTSKLVCFINITHNWVNVLILMLISLRLVQVVKTSGDVHIADSAIGAVAGSGAHIGTVTQLHPPSKNEGVSSNKSISISF